MTDLTNREKITALLRRHGFRFSRALGQNFLIAAWVPERIAEESLAGPDDGVLEVGPGIGCLTRELARRAGRVSCLELDESLRPVLAETLAGCDNVTVTFADALRTDLKAHCEKTLGARPWRVCASLPYNAATALIAAFLNSGLFSGITVMIQKEVAARLAAGPGSPDYGALSVLTQWRSQGRILFDVPPGCFYPQPKVTSSVIRLTPLGAPPAAVADEAFFFRTVRAAFAQRRKTLVNSLAAGMPEFSKAALSAAAAACSLPPAVRGEALSLPQFAALSNALYERR